jgi:hypothetical protein
MSPDTLQSLGILAIGLGFVLIGLGGFSTYHASQQIQRTVELREAEQKGEMNAQLLTLMMKNQQLQEQTGRPADSAPAAEAAPPPAAYYFRPPAPPPPPTYGQAAPATPVPGEEGAAAPAATPEPVGEMPGASLDPLEAAQTPEWHEPESLEPVLPSRYLSVRQKEVIAETLRAHGRHMVKIESSYGEKESREFAEELGEAFTAADWDVLGIDVHRGLPLASGVTVSAGSFPPQPETRAMYEALLSAGIAVTQQLDPKQQNSETVVLVGTPL